ncbi:MAG TPA: hypothetical protein ENH13_00690 [Euryarchaeota archaeon]|nr:hypothetical protein BMS3Abin16_01199 [archaeon BMS3Abin16]GBE56433.1 hypothetical protein BMS3Bbin16_00638 [archaeon BMS3Bbin16]HDH27627.1 hypothetical protein [Euryarchaeota archaeon]
MARTQIRCMDCAFFALASEGLDQDRCRLFDRPLSRIEVMNAVDCDRFEERVEGRDVDHYIPERSEKKEAYHSEIMKYSIYMVVLVVLGIGFFYLVTTMV